MDYRSIHLLLQVGETRVKAALYHTSENSMVTVMEYTLQAGLPLDSYPEMLTRLFTEEEIFTKPYSTETICLESPDSTLLPSSLFEDSRKESYLRLVRNLPDGLAVRSDEIISGDIRNIYGVHPAWLRPLLDRFPSATLLNHVTPLLRGLALQSRKPDHEVLICCQLRGKLMDLVIFKEGRLHYCNSFSFANREELTYYILFVLDQLSLPPTKQHVVFLGIGKDDHALVNYCGGFLGDTTIGFGEETDYRCRTSPPFPSQRYFNLTSLRL